MGGEKKSRDHVTVNRDDGESCFTGFLSYVYVDATSISASSGEGFKDGQSIKNVCISSALYI